MAKTEIRSRAKHDRWQALLPWPILLLDGAENDRKVLRAISEAERKKRL